tara:strand:+ start:218 stop:895 length:678 start_codon:yes stop_codon:yes gene_type:complete
LNPNAIHAVVNDINNRKHVLNLKPGTSIQYQVLLCTVDKKPNMDVVLENADMTTLILQKVDPSDIVSTMLVNKAFHAIASPLVSDPKAKLASLRNALAQELNECDLVRSLESQRKKQRAIHTFLETVVVSYFDLLLDPVVSDGVFRLLNANKLFDIVFPLDSSEELREMKRVRKNVGYRLQLHGAEKKTVAELKGFAQTKIADTLFEFSRYRKKHLVEFVRTTCV